MPRNLQKQAAKQQARIAALNTLGTPVSSQPGSDVEEDWETTSDASTVDSTATLDEVSLGDEVRRCVDDLGEKRASTREVALAKLNKLLAHHYCGTFFAENASSQEALLQLLSRSLRKPGSAKEAQLASRGIGLAFVNQAELSNSEQEGLYEMVLSLLKTTIIHSLDSELKYQSIETLAFITFIAASQADTKGGLEYFYNVLASEGENLQPEELEEDERLSSADIDRLMEACLRAYGLLYASLYGDGRGTWENAWDESQSVMPVHLELLESKSKQIRISAGENVALMFDCVKTLKEADDEDENGATPEYAEMDELKDALQRLSTDRNRRVKKQDRKEQRTAFRDINRSIETGDRPKQRLKIGGTLLHFRGWAQLVELAAFRNFLGPGLARHLQENELLQAVFSGNLEESSESRGEESKEVGVGTAFGFEGEDDDFMLSARSSAGKRDRARRLKMSKGR